jgi:hypothetical protein
MRPFTKFGTTMLRDNIVPGHREFGTDCIPGVRFIRAITHLLTRPGGLCPGVPTQSLFPRLPNCSLMLADFLIHPREIVKELRHEEGCAPIL